MPTEPPKTVPIKLLKAPQKVPSVMVGRLFPLSKLGDAVVGGKIDKPKRN